MTDDKHAAESRGVHFTPPFASDLSALEFFFVTGKALSCGDNYFVEACGTPVKRPIRNRDALPRDAESRRCPATPLRWGLTLRADAAAPKLTHRYGESGQWLGFAGVPPKANSKY
jgi:hypothetical protein